MRMRTAMLYIAMYGKELSAPVTSRVPHTSRGVMVLLTGETASDDIISAVRIEDENGFC